MKWTVLFLYIVWGFAVAAGKEQSRRMREAAERMRQSEYNFDFVLSQQSFEVQEAMKTVVDEYQLAVRQLLYAYRVKKKPVRRMKRNLNRKHRLVEIEERHEIFTKKSASPSKSKKSGASKQVTEQNYIDHGEHPTVVAVDRDTLEYFMGEEQGGSYFAYLHENPLW